MFTVVLFPSVPLVLTVKSDVPAVEPDLKSTLPIAPPEYTFACLTLVGPANI